MFIFILLLLDLDVFNQQSIRWDTEKKNKHNIMAQ